MNNFKKEEDHSDIHDERRKLGNGGHELHEGNTKQQRDAFVRNNPGSFGNQQINLQHSSEIHLEDKQREENKEIMQKLDLDSMFKQFSTKSTEAQSPK
jgi:hypothetical protein